MSILQQNVERWFPMILFVVRDVGSGELFIESKAPENFTLREIEGVADLTEFLSEPSLLPSRISAHQDIPPERRDALTPLRLAAIAARFGSGAEFAGSLSVFGSAARSITVDVKGLHPCAVANCYCVLEGYGDRGKMSMAGYKEHKENSKDATGQAGGILEIIGAGKPVAS